MLKQTRVLCTVFDWPERRASGSIDTIERATSVSFSMRVTSMVRVGAVAEALYGDKKAHDDFSLLKQPSV